MGRGVDIEMGARQERWMEGGTDGERGMEKEADIVR